MKKNKAFMIGGSLILLISLGTSCSRYESTEETREAPKRQTSTASGIEAVSPYISVGNITSEKLEVYAYSWPDWNVAGAKVWSFEPTTALGFSTAGAAYFVGGPTDAKVHYNSAFSGATSVVAITDNSWAGLVTWEGTTPRGTKLWGKYWTGASPGIHSGELLPNGNMALAAANENWVRVYNTSVLTGSNYDEFSIRQAHAVLWDPAYNVLWTCGDTEAGASGKGILTALIVGGTRTAPTLTEDATKRDTITGGRYPHDIAPYYGDVNKLWVSTNSTVFIYDKINKTFTPAPGASNRTYVKGISNQTEGGVIVETKGLDTYANSVDFFNPTTGAAAGSRTVTGAQFYKGKVFTRAYQ